MSRRGAAIQWRMRVIAAIAVLLVVVVVALWQFDLLPGTGARTPAAPPVPDIFAAAQAGDADAVRAALSEGGNVEAVNDAGLTTLMAAAAGGASDEVLATLIDAGAAVNAQAANGVDALMLASRGGSTATVLYLLNAGADPTLTDAEGKGVLDYVADNTAVRSSGLYPRLVELTKHPFAQGWPSGYVVPFPGSTVTSRRHHLPGSPREYRKGVHQGVDWYSGVISVPIEYDTEVQAVVQGTVIRADTDYQEMTLPEYQQVIDDSLRSLDPPANLLDKLRGRQVWVRAPGGFVVRYAHLGGIADGIVEGAKVAQGDVIGLVGNSGTEEAARQTQTDPHLHLEIWNGDTYLGQNLQVEQIYDTYAQVFGQAARPPYHD